MAVFSPVEVALATGGRLLTPGHRSRLTGVTTDSRTAQTGQLFIPLKGDRFDGHDFIPAAVARGVGGILAASAWWRQHRPAIPPEVAVTLVPDTLQALGDLAAYWRCRFSGPVVAVTGSCGKTTTKEMIARVLSCRGPVLKNELNLNNLIGLPLTLLELARNHWAAVVEMGMNRFGEIRRLARIAQPNILVLTNVHAAHLAGVGSLAGVAQAKTEALEALAPDGMVIYNADDPMLSSRLAQYRGRTLGYGLGSRAALQGGILKEAPGRLEAVWRWQGQKGYLRLLTSGVHQLYNALAAFAVGLVCGLPPAEIAAALAAFRPLKQRTQWLEHHSGLWILNDSYNANPGSMAMALRTLAAQRREGAQLLAALGDMLELGPATAAAHREIGALAARLGYAHLVVYGDFKEYVREGALAAGMAPGQVHLVSSHAAGAALLRQLARPGDLLLVKGSRGARMEKLLACLE